MNLSSASPHVQYTRLVEPYCEELAIYDFKNIQLQNGVSLGEEIPKIVNEINKITENNLISFKSNTLSSVITYFHNVVPNRTFFQMTCIWPPVYPILVKSASVALKFIAKLCTLVKNPEFFIYWLIIQLFPNNWSSNGSITSNLLKIFSNCRIVGNKNDMWAFISQDDKFEIVYHNKDSNKYMEYDSFYANNVAITQAGVMIENKDHTHSIKIELSSKQQQNLWKNASSKKEVYFVSFLNNMKKPYPAQILNALLNVITSNDWYFIRSLLCDSVLPLTKENQPIILDIFYIYSYCGKVPVLISSLFTKLIQNHRVLSLKHVFEKNSHLSFIFRIIANDYCDKYNEDVLSKVSNYIDTKEIINQENVEIVIITIIKVIIESFNYIPNQVRLIASIICAFTKVRYNNRNFVLKVLSEFFFGNIIIPLLKKLLGTSEKLYSSNSKLIINILKDVFSFKTLEGELSMINNRLIKHTFPRMERFLFGLGDILYSPSFEQPTKLKLESSLIQILDFINIRSELVEQSFVKEIKESKYQPTSAGWFLAANLTQLFQQESDEAVIREHLNWSYPQSTVISENTQIIYTEVFSSNSTSTSSFTISDFERQFGNSLSDKEEEDSEQLPQRKISDKGSESSATLESGRRLIGKNVLSSCSSMPENIVLPVIPLPPPLEGEIESPVDDAENSYFDGEEDQEKERMEAPPLPDEVEPLPEEEPQSKDFAEFAPLTLPIIPIPDAPIDSTSHSGLQAFGGSDVSSWASYGSLSEPIHKNDESYISSCSIPNIVVTTSKEEFAAREKQVQEQTGGIDNGPIMVLVVDDEETSPQPKKRPKKRSMRKSNPIKSKKSSSSKPNDNDSKKAFINDQNSDSEVKVGNFIPDEKPPSPRTLRLKNSSRSPLVDSGDSSSPFNTIENISDEDISGVINDIHSGSNPPETEKKKSKRKKVVPKKSKASTPKKKNKKKAQRSIKQ